MADIEAPTDYTPRQQVALKGLAQLLATAVKRKLERERPDLARPRNDRTPER